MTHMQQRTASGFGEALTAIATHVVVVDDDPDMRGLVAHALRREGYEVSEAIDGNDLFHLLGSPDWQPHHPPPDLVVCDLRMPDISGFEVLGVLNSYDWDIPVIVMSAMDDEGIRREAMKLGAAAFFQKPFEPRMLVGQVARALGRA